MTLYSWHSFPFFPQFSIFLKLFRRIGLLVCTMNWCNNQDDPTEIKNITKFTNIFALETKFVIFFEQIKSCFESAASVQYWSASVLPADFLSLTAPGRTPDMVSFVFIYWVVTVTADIRQNKTKKTPNFLIIFLKAEVKWKCPKLKWKCWSKIEQLFRQMSWVNSSFIGEKISRMILQINVLITGESNFDVRNIQEMFNWSEVHSERNNFLKIHTLMLVLHFTNQIT